MSEPAKPEPLNKVSSLFEIPSKRLGPCGSSITSFAYEPRPEEGKGPKKVHYENTYQLEPPGKFRADKVKPIIEHVLETNLNSRRYDPIECSILCKSLAEDIKLKVKELNFKRYKIVSVVLIGEKKEQGVRVGSRFLWDVERDNFSSAMFENKSLYAVGNVYAVYFE